MNNKKLFVGSLPWSVDDAGLAQIFSQAGTVVSAQVVKDRDTGRSRGFAFVEMSSDKEADEAIKKFNNFEIEGRKIVVNVAKPMEDRSGPNPNRGNYSRSGNRW